MSFVDVSEAIQCINVNKKIEHKHKLILELKFCLKQKSTHKNNFKFTKQLRKISTLCI